MQTPPTDNFFSFSTLRERALGLWYKVKRLYKEYGWILLWCVGVSTVLFLAIALVQGPMYISNARLMASGQIKIPEGAVFQEERMGYFGTQMNILQSMKVQKDAYDRVAALNPELKPIKVKLNIGLSEDAAILKITATGSEPLYTQAYLSAIIASYQDFKRQMRAQTAETASVAIRDELVKQQREIDEAEAAKVQFQKEHNVTFMKEQVETVGRNLIKLKGQMAELTTQYNLLKDADIDTLPPGTEQLAGLEAAKEYLSLKAQLQNQEIQLGQYKKFMRPNHPKLLGAQEKVARLKSMIEAYKVQTRDSIVFTRQSIKTQMDNLAGVISEWEKRALEYTQEMADFQRIDDRLTRAQNMYERLITSVQTVDVSQKLSSDLLSVLEDATPSIRVPSYFLKRAAIGAIFGALLGGAVLFIISLFDNRMSSLEEISSQVQYPVLGVIPAQATGANQRLPIIRRDDDRPVLAEAYRNLRATLSHTQTQGKAAPRVLLLTSSIPSEGKTTVSANLAVALSLTGARVLVVDADLRKGRLHEDFSIANTQGLSDLLHGQPAQPHAYTPTLHVITRGNVLDHPAELITDRSFGALVASWRAAYDWVIIDTPPLLAAEDAILIMPHTDATLYVVRAHFTQSSQMQAALRMLRQRLAEPTGIIFNLLDLAHPNYYHYKYADYYHRGTPSSPSPPSQS